MEIEYIPLPKLKQEIHRADLPDDQVFVYCMPRPAVAVDQMHNMQDKSNYDRLDPVQLKGRSLRPGNSRVRGFPSASTWRRPSNTPRH